MILLDRVTKLLPGQKPKKELLSAVTISIPSDRKIGVCTTSPEEAVAFIDLLAGVTLPTAGRIVRRARVSFPVGHLGGFDLELSARFNIRHIARLYDADPDVIVDFVQGVAALDEYFDKPFGQLPRSQRRRLGEIVALAIPFEVYLFPDYAIASERRTGSKLAALFQLRAGMSGLIIPMRDIKIATHSCDLVMTLQDGRLAYLTG